MGFINKLFGKGVTNKESIAIDEKYKEFWNWFDLHKDKFKTTLVNNERVVEDFIEVAGPKLKELNESFNILVGMSGGNLAELIVTVDGSIKDIVFAEDFIDKAPTIEGWNFLANKPAHEGIALTIYNHNFSSDTISFLPINNPEFPDEIALRFIIDGYTKEEENNLGNGLYIFLDNYIGELKTVTLIDYLEVRGEESKIGEEIPLNKLAEYLAYRESEFVEKYNAVKHNEDNDKHMVLQANQDDIPYFISINKTLLDWEQKVSYPWIVKVDLDYEGNDNLLPGGEQVELLNEIEDMLIDNNIEDNSLLYVVRLTGNNQRSIFCVTKDFRKASKQVNKVLNLYKDKIKTDYTIYKDKYWFSLEKFKPAEE